jgi:hypothetical protein
MDRPLSIAATRCRQPQRTTAQGRFPPPDRGPAEACFRRNLAALPRPGE